MGLIINEDSLIPFAKTRKAKNSYPVSNLIRSHLLLLASRQGVIKTNNNGFGKESLEQAIAAKQSSRKKIDISKLGEIL